MTRKTRSKWKNLSVVNVYVSYIPENIEFHNVYPEERQKEIDKALHPRVKKERFWVWEILKIALEKGAELKFEDLKFKKSKEGRWYIKDYHFSLSHTDDMVAVAISNYPVGVDVELKNRKMPPIDMDVTTWSKKESIFKWMEKGNFDYRKINENDYPCAAYSLLEKFVLTLCSEHNLIARFFIVKDGKVEVLKGEDLIRV